MAKVRIRKIDQTKFLVGLSGFVDSLKTEAAIQKVLAKDLKREADLRFEKTEHYDSEDSDAEEEGRRYINWENRLFWIDSELQCLDWRRKDLLLKLGGLRHGFTFVFTKKKEA